MLTLCHGLVWLKARCPLKPLCHSPSSAGQGRKNMVKDLWVKVGTWTPWTSPMWVLQEQAAPAWIPHGVTSPVSKSAPAWAPLSMGPQVRPRVCSSASSAPGHSLLRASTCSGVRSSTGCRWISAPPLTSVGYRRTAFLTMVLSTGSRGISARVPEAHPPPPSSLTLLSAELFLSHILSPLSLLLLPSSFFPFLNMLSLRLYYLHWWLSLGQQWVSLGGGWHWLYQTWGKLLAASHRCHSCSPAATKILPRKPTTPSPDPAPISNSLGNCIPTTILKTG